MEKWRSTIRKEKIKELKGHEAGEEEGNNQRRETGGKKDK